MATTRFPQGSTPPPAAGSKRAAPNSASPAAKRGKSSNSGKTEKEQLSIEESMGAAEEGGDIVKKVNVNGGEAVNNGDKSEGNDDVKGHNGDMEKSDFGTEQPNGNSESLHHHEENNVETGGKDGLQSDEKNGLAEVKSDEADAKKAATIERDAKTADIPINNGSIVETDKREAAIPSSILEKGIIYFFYRGRVGVENPQGIEDVARSYIILRPIPLGASIGEGPLEDLGTSRLLALPKKMMPKSTKDRFLVFVEKPKATIKELRDGFEHNDYSTKTSGTSHVPSATPFAEGVYAITTTGRESHLAYEITAPKIGDLQKDLGVNEKGSYVLSVKNPKAPGPANASLDNPAEYPEAIQSKFRELRWTPLEPEMLDYVNAQVLIIGEGMGILGKATEELSKDQKDDSKEKPEEELDQLQEEDHDRVDHLKENDPVFADLGLSAKEYSKMKSTW